MEMDIIVNTLTVSDMVELNEAGYEFTIENGMITNVTYQG